LPNAYLVLDVETSGFSGSINPNGTPACIAQFGIAAVRNREITHNYSYLVKRPPGTMQPGASAVNRITDEMLAEQGELPEILYPRLIRLLEVFREDRCPYIGQNVVKFDAPFINDDFARHGFDFRFELSELIDTGLIYKANQLCVAPRDDEALDAFFERVAEIRSRVKWNLGLTMRTLHLDAKFGLDLEGAHDAGYDCYMTHLLLEELRQLANGAPSGL